MFYDILERKNLFLGYKKIQVQKLKKIETIPKEVNPWLGQKMAIFPTFFFGNIDQENVFHDILERKNAYLGYKNKKFKKSKY